MFSTEPILTKIPYIKRTCLVPQYVNNYVSFMKNTILTAHRYAGVQVTIYVRIITGNFFLFYRF